MINLGLNRKKADASATKVATEPACVIRLRKDMTELELTSNITMHFPEGNEGEKMLHFELSMCPDEGIYRGGKFVFDVTIPFGYPHEAPKVICKTKVFHPNIDLEGKVCLNILREDWRPVLNVSSVIHGLLFLFLEPNPGDPLNKEAAQMFKDNPKQFELYVQRSIVNGAHIQNSYFPPCRV